MNSFFMKGRMCSTGRSLGGILVVVVALAAVYLAFSPQAVLAQATVPFTCNEDLYIMQAETDGVGSLSQLYKIDRYDFNNLVEIGGENTRYNAIGYNPQDNYIYGIHDRSSVTGTPLGTVYKIDSNGNTSSLGVPVDGADPNPGDEWPSTAERWNAGTVLPTGEYVLVNDRGSGDGSPMWIVVVDVTQSPPVVVSAVQLSDQTTRFWDIAYRPQDGKIYGYDIGQYQNAQHQFATIDPSTGTVSHFGVTQNNNSEELRNGSIFFDSVGDVYMYGGDYDGGNNVDQDRFYIGDIDSATTPPLGTYIELAEGEVVVASDGTSCPYYVAMRKTVEPLSSYPGGTVTYTYDIGNYLPYDQTSVTFTDVMADGRTFVAGTLIPASPGGGTVNAYAGTNTLQITGMTLSSESITTLSIDVLVPLSATPGTVYNQSTLTDLTGVPDIPSDYPLLPGDEDPTPLIIEARPIIGDFVWHDLNGNGIQDDGEPGIKGFTVRILDPGPDETPGTSDDRLVDTTTTSDDGIYSFTVAPGDYFVQFVKPTGATFSPKGQGGDDKLDSDADPTTGYSDLISVGPSDVDNTIDAGIQGALPVSLSYVYAVRIGGSTVRFAWETATEAGNAGFNIYIVIDDVQNLVTPEMIPSSAIDSVEPVAYSYKVNVTGEQFYIEMVDISGGSELHGPFDLGKAYGSSGLSSGGSGVDGILNPLFLPAISGQ